MDSSDTPDINPPPGTVRLSDRYHSGHDGEVILHPTPTNDPNDPLNWSKLRKGINFGIACSYVLITFVFLDISAVAIGPYMQEFGWTLSTFTYAAAAGYSGLATGCILFIPLIHRYGRRPVYLVSLTIQLAAVIWCAKVSSRAEYIAAAAIGGLGGAIAETIVQVTITDLFFMHQRATMNGIFLFMQSTGAFLGPVAAGYVVVGLGWRWMWWITSILSAVNLVLAIFFFEETKFVPVVLGESSNGANARPPSVNANDKGEDLKRIGSRHSQKTSVDADIPRKKYVQRIALVTKTDTPIAHRFYQPLMILFTIPAVAYVSIVYGLLLTFFTVLATILSYYMIAPPYNFDSAAIGLISIAPFIGAALGTVLGGPANDRLSLWLARRNNGIFEPEMRLYLVFPGTLLCIAGICMHGIGLADLAPWPVIACGFGIFGAGFTIVGDGALTYLSDAYLDIVSDSLVAVTFCRNAFSIAVLFGLTPWLAKVGLRNLFVTVACIAVVLVLMAVPLIMYGKRIRARTTERYKRYAVNQPILRGL